MLLRLDTPYNIGYRFADIKIAAVQNGNDGRAKTISAKLHPDRGRKGSARYAPNLRGHGRGADET